MPQMVGLQVLTWDCARGIHRLSANLGDFTSMASCRGDLLVLHDIKDAIAREKYPIPCAQICSQGFQGTIP